MNNLVKPNANGNNEVSLPGGGNEAFRLLVEYNKDGISLIDQQGIIIYVNPSVLSITGYAGEEMIGTRGSAIIHPEDVASFEKLLSAFTEKQCITHEFRILHKNGTWRWVESNTTNLLSTEGINAIVSNYRDITDKRLPEQRVIQNERMLRDLANAMPQLVWIAEPNGSVSYYNDRVNDYTGAQMNDDGTWNWSPMVHPDDATYTEEAWKNAVKTKSVYTCDHRVMLKDGTYRHHLSRGYPQFNEAGEIEKWYGTATDVDELKEAQALLEEYARELSQKVDERTLELKQQKDFAETLLDSSVDMIVVYDHETRLVNANRRFFETYKLTKEAITGKKLLDIFPGGEVGVERLEMAFKGENLFFPSMKAIDDRYYESYLIPLKKDQEKVDAVMVVAHDVTGTVRAGEMLKLSSEQLKTVNESLLKKNEELEQFAYVASHDLQEPLRKVTTFARMLEKSFTENPENCEKYIQKIIQSSNRMSQLILDILRFSQLSKDEGFEKTDLNEILRNVMIDLELVIEQKEATVEITSLPIIEAIPRQMSQLFYNLISNGLKFVIPGIKPRITLSCEMYVDHKGSDSIRDRQYYRISVRDNGIGFNAEYADRIFQMFQRLNSREEFSGSGIGLAMVKKIIASHYGFIEVESEEGKGSVFHVILPAKHIQ